MIDSSDNLVVEVSLRVWGDSLRPEFVTEALNAEPTYSHVKGYEKVSPTGKIRIMKSGYWRLDTKKLVDSRFFLDHLDYLMEVLKSSNQNVRLISGVQGAEISFVLGVNEDDSLEFIIASDVLKKIVQLGIELRFVVV